MVIMYPVIMYPVSILVDCVTTSGVRWLSVMPLASRFIRTRLHDG